MHSAASKSFNGCQHQRSSCHFGNGGRHNCSIVKVKGRGRRIVFIALGIRGGRKDQCDNQNSPIVQGSITCPDSPYSDGRSDPSWGQEYPKRSTILESFFFGIGGLACLFYQSSTCWKNQSWILSIESCSLLKDLYCFFLFCTVGDQPARRLGYYQCGHNRRYYTWNRGPETQ